MRFPRVRRSRGTLAAGALAVVGLVALGGCSADARQDPTATVMAPESPSPASEPAPTAHSGPSHPVETADPSAVPTPSSSVDPGPALESATWGENEGGRSLAVVPAPWVRTSQDLAAVDRLWAELVEAEPEADTTGMYDQLVCHAIGAPDKDSWNLEPWRPDVGLVAVVQARCNPR